MADEGVEALTTRQHDHPGEQERVHSPHATPRLHASPQLQLCPVPCHAAGRPSATAELTRPSPLPLPLQFQHPSAGYHASASHACCCTRCAAGGAATCEPRCQAAQPHAAVASPHMLASC